MEHETTVPVTGKEMNFFDLCVVCARALGRGCALLWRLLAHMLRLTFRFWWLVIPVVLVAAAAAFYQTRATDLVYRMNAVAMLNGASIQQFEQAFAPLRSGRMMPDDAAIRPYLNERMISHFDTYCVVDCKHDGIADYVDFKRKSSPTDTIKVQMHDRLCLQFRVKSKYMPLVPEIEAALLEFLNANEAMCKSYDKYLSNLRAEVEFNHHQAVKLDSLTSSYYFHSPSEAQPLAYNGNGVNFYGDRRIRLFLDEIYEQQLHVQQGDYRLQLATAPVVLENHFAADPKPVNGRLKMLLCFILIGWCGACALAALIDRRKEIISWLKQ